MMNTIINNIERRNDIKRVFGDSNRYYLDDLICSIQEKLQVLDPCSEEYRILFERLMRLDEGKSAYDKGVREDEERKNERDRRIREIELKEKQIRYDYDLAKKKVEARIAEREAEIALEHEKLNAYQEMEEARIYAERERAQMEYQRYTMNYSSNSSSGLLEGLTIGATLLGVVIGACCEMIGGSSDYIEDSSYYYE